MSGHNPSTIQGPVECSRENISEGLASRLIERMKLKYVGNCKCGSCHLVPLDLISEVTAFVCQASPSARAAISSAEGSRP